MKYCMHCGKELRCYTKAEGGSLYNVCFECHEKIDEVGSYISKQLKDKIIIKIQEEELRKMFSRNK